MIRPKFEEAFAFIQEAQEAGKAAYIHCSVGMSRSATIAIAYIMKSTNVPLDQAFAAVKEHRAVSAPNIGFMTQLVEFEVELFGRSTIDLEKYKANRFEDLSEFRIAYSSLTHCNDD